MFEYTNVFRLADMKMCRIQLELINYDELFDNNLQHRSSKEDSSCEQSSSSSDMKGARSPMGGPFLLNSNEGTGGAKTPTVISRHTTLRGRLLRPLITIREVTHSPEVGSNMRRRKSSLQMLEKSNKNLRRSDSEFGIVLNANSYGDKHKVQRITSGTNNERMTMI